ncbi:MAG: substrate-binding domain-containing protein [Lachnospiraceae bacterium]|nr:substrate-binding domain-containing protein [Lachnospiraceae bacterium]
MKKKLISMLLSATMVAALLSGCGGASGSGSADAKASTAAPAADTAASTAAPAGDAAASTAAPAADGAGASGHTYAIVTKSAGNPYNEREAAGFQEVIEAAGGTCIVQNPESATADAQISVIQSLISQGVDSIAIAANDANALASVCQEAIDAGIKVLTLDSDVNSAVRATFCNQAGVQEVGQALVDAVYDLTGGEGQYAILSATSQATNQNAWIEAMKKIQEGDSKYSKLELVEVAYGDDEPQKSTDQTQALLQNYPDLKVICAPTTVGIAAAAKVLQDQGSAVKLTGLGLPSEMAEYIGADDKHSCPYMFLWNPIDLGKLAGYASIALVDGKMTGAVGDSFEAGDMELSPYTLTELADGSGSEVILGPPFQFNPDNIAEWKEVY